MRRESPGSGHIRERGTHPLEGDFEKVFWRGKAHGRGGIRIKGLRNSFLNSRKDIPEGWEGRIKKTTKGEDI